MASLLFQRLSLFALLNVVVFVVASPPEPVVKCSSGNTTCVVTNTYGTFPDRSTCKVAVVVYPSNEAELLEVVSAASKRHQHMKVVTKYGHSIPKLSCPGGPPGEGLAISTLYLNKVVNVDHVGHKMTVESGITLQEFLDASASHGLALPSSPYWYGLTVGGLLATGAHGSSLFGKGSAVHEYVVGMRLVVPVKAGGATIVDLREGDPDLLAAKVSLGVLGVVFQVTLQLQSLFKRSVTYRVEKDSSLESRLTSFGETTEFGDFTWFPSQSTVAYRDDVRVPISTAGDGENDFIAFRPSLSNSSESARTTEESVEMSGNIKGRCIRANSNLAGGVKLGFGLNNDKNSDNFMGYPVVGNPKNMQASGSCLNAPDQGNLLTTCAWDPRVNGSFFHQTAISIPLTSVPAFISDIKRLRRAKPHSLCAVDAYAGFPMRFIRNSTAYLGKTCDSVEFDMIYYRSHDPNIPRLFEDVMEEIEQMALFKYNGLPHFGKNRNIAFLGIQHKFGSKLDKFVKVMRKYDPKGLFSSDWTDAVLGLNGSVMIEKKGCALEGLCVCSCDEHCAPEKGYFCKPGIVYKKARVCRKT